MKDFSNFRLVICDIDGTLAPKHSVLTPQAVQVIHDLKDKGVYFGIASGRPLFQIFPTMKEWGFDDFDVVIGLNGGEVHDGITQEDHTYFCVKKEYIPEALEIMSPFPTDPSLLRTDYQLFLHDSEMMRQFANKLVSFKTRVADSVEEFCSEDTGKLMFRMKEELMPEVEAYLKDHPSEHFSYQKTQLNLMEFCHPQCAKDYGLQKFCEAHGITMDQVIAFGDMANDIPMMKVAGYSVCLLNGSDETKAAASAVTEKTCDDDGWADWMNHHFMPSFIK
mgnify:CR=1 FL=1